VAAKKLKEKQGKLRTSDSSKKRMNLTGSPSIIRHVADMRDLLMAPLVARRVGAMVMGAQRNVGSLKLLSLRRNRSQVGSQTSSRYPSRKLGRNGRNRSSCSISRIRVVNFVLMIRSSSVQTARPIDIAGETTNQSAAEILSMKVPEIGATSRTKGKLPVRHRFLSKARRALRGAREMPNHEIEAQTTSIGRSKSERPGIGIRGRSVDTIVIHWLMVIDLMVATSNPAAGHHRVLSMVLDIEGVMGSDFSP